MTKRLYYDDATLTTFAAEVTDIREVSREKGQSLWQIALNRSAFYPTSGGQPYDLGTLEATARSGAKLVVPVIAVEEDEAGEVWHSVQKPLLAGTAVQGMVDWSRRLDHMQQHTGQHLLSTAFVRECGAQTVSFHLGAESSTIDLAVEKLAAEDLIRMEQLANSMIAEDRAVSLRTLPRAEAEALLASGALRKLPEREGMIRVVEIADFDLNACGGTHVRSTGQIGGLLLRKVEKVRQGVRVEFVCGLRAVATARRDFELLTQSSLLLSAPAQQLPELIAKQLAEAKATAKERHALLEELAAYHATKLLVAYPEDNGLHYVSAVLPGNDAVYAKLLASKMVAAAPRTVVLVASTAADPATVVLARAASPDAIHCGNLLRTHLETFGVRGGGSAEMAQGAIPVAQLEALLTQLGVAIRMQAGLLPTHSA
ncbi:MAG: alanyl-tRNA editing protein [Acidobacteriaceae bacterium]